SLLLTVTFISSDGKNAGVAKLHNKDAYDLLQGYMSAPENMIQLVAYPIANDEQIFIPSNSISMVEYALSIDDINPNKLVNALFSKPSLVSTNMDESYFTDSQRDMSLL